MMKVSGLTLIAIAALLLAPTPRVRAAHGFTVNAGNIAHVVLTQNVSTKTNKPGDKIQARCTGGDCGGFPTGTKFFAVISEVSPAAGPQPGKLHGSFTTAVLPDGRHIAIEAQAQAGGHAQGATTTHKTGNGQLSKSEAIIAGMSDVVAGNDLGRALSAGSLGTAMRKKQTTTTIGHDIEAPHGTKFQLRILKPVTVASASK